MPFFRALRALLLALLLSTALPTPLWASPDGGQASLPAIISQVPNPHAPVIRSTVMQDYGITKGGKSADGAAESGACGPIDLVFVIDTTGSMGGALDSVDAELAGLLRSIETASGGDYRLALVTFKDDVTVNESFGTRNRTSIASKILGLSASGGGNTPEASDRALSLAVNGFSYRASALKIAVLVTDAPPAGFDDEFTPGVDDVAARLVAQQAAAKNIKVSSIFVPTNGLDASIISIMQTYARLSSGFYTQTASNGVGTGAGIQQIVARCGGNLVFLQPTDGQKLLALPAVIRGRATPNDGENFSRVTLAIQRGQDDFYWTGSSWASRFKALPTRLESTNWSASDGSYALPSGKDLLEDTYRLIAFAYDGSGKQSKSAAITIEIGTDSEVSLLDANDLQSRAERTKAVADGVTQILVKFTTDQSGLVSFEKRDDLKTDRGSLTQQDGAGSAENLQTIREGSNFVAFALYTVPKQLPGAEAKVKFVVKFAADAGGSATRSRELGLVRPPVVLVHGLWSNPDGAFPDNGAGVRSFLKGAGFKIGVADYSGSNADHFTDNVGKVREAIRSVKQDYRDKKIAITQVDVVAHSMGGLLTRLFVQGEFRGSSTFGKGSVRRLITLGTPHYGSSLANLLVLLRGKSSFGIGLTGIASFIKHPINRGAIDDLQLGSGALIAIDTTPVRSFAVVGNVPNNAGAVLGDVTKVLYLYLRITGSPLDRVDLSSEGAFLSSLFNRENSDLIVGTSSQKGGLSSRYNDVFAPVAHFDLSRFGVPGETVDNFVALSVVKLLSGPEDDLAPAFPDVTARSFSAFSAPPPVPAPIPGRASATAPEVKLITLSPAEATVFAPGQSVVFRATPLAGANVKQVLFITGYDDALESNLIEAAPFQATFVIPADFSGDYRVVALARDAAGNLEQIQRTYKVLPAAPPQSLRIEPTSMRLTSQNATRALAVFGTFAGGVSIDLSSAVTGTKYSTSDSSIATVSAEGVVTAKNSGNAIVTATNGGQSADALVTVQFNAPVVTGLTPPNAAPGARNLTLQISGSDFGGAASVEFLLNGEPDPNISVSNLRVGDSNSEIKVTVNVSSAAATGERSVVVTTPGGRSAEEIGEGNLFTVGSLSADLGVTLTASPTPALVGAGLTYTVVVSNSGPATATGVRASIVLPANTQFVGATSAQSTCALSGNTLVCEVGSLAAGQSVSIQIVVRPTRDATLSATATVSGDTTDPNPANNSATRALTAITPLTDVTSKVRVNLGTLYRVTDYSGGVFNRKRERRFRQTVTIRNKDNTALRGPVSLVFDGLTKDVTVKGLQGRTARIAPLNSPYLDVPVGSDLVLSPSESITLTLEFSGPTRVAYVRFKTRVLAGSGRR